MTEPTPLPLEPSGSRSTAAWYWICQAIGWSGFMAWILGFYVMNTPRVRATDVFNIVLFTAIVPSIYSHAMRVRLRRWRWFEMPMRSLVPRLFVAVAIAAALMTTGSIVSLRLLDGPPWLPWFARISMFVSFSWAFAGWLFIYSAVQMRRRHERLQIVARDAQLGALRAQLNPHFLFNSLNSMRALIADNPDKAASSVTGLADILRYSLQADRRDTVPLGEELAVVDEYLGLERVRFEERLMIERDIDPRALQARVPPMLLQTLVENAVKHGIAPAIAGGRIGLAVRIAGPRVEISVTNSGEFTPPADQSGHGLMNATERLRLTYGNAATLTVTSANDVTTATVSLPLQAPG